MAEVDQADLFLNEKERRRTKETPLMRQYWKIKDRHPGALLLFRMGDFYETFEQDAVIVADVLGIELRQPRAATDPYAIEVVNIRQAELVARILNGRQR